MKTLDFSKTPKRVDVQKYQQHKYDAQNEQETFSDDLLSERLCKTEPITISHFKSYPDLCKKEFQIVPGIGIYLFFILV